MGKDWTNFRDLIRPNFINCNHPHAERAFHDFVNCLEESQIRSWASCGTLLGIIRDDNLIPWDNDADFDYFDKTKNIYSIFIPSLLENGFTVITRVGWLFTNVTAIRDGFKCSLGQVKKIGKLFFSRSMNYPVSSVFGKGDLTHIQFLKANVPLPNNPSEYLEFTYGNWQIPNKSNSIESYSRKQALNKKLVYWLIRLIDNSLVIVKFKLFNSHIS
jgi:hypothetical protein